jgi:putative membrane protein
MATTVADMAAMNKGSVQFIQNWMVNTFGVLIAVALVPGIDYDSVLALLLASLLLGVLNAAVRPFLLVLALPLVLVTLGLFIIVINAGLLYLVSGLVPGFRVESFGSSLLGALIIGLVAFLLNGLTGRNRFRVRVKTHRPPRDPDDRGNGPVIDV